MTRYLTKSRFKEAWECRTKLFYTGKKEYGNTKVDNAFLQALARGGFQVGKLAQLMYPGGIEVETLDSEKAITETRELLKRENVVIFEAALQHGRLLARVDILVKEGDRIRLIEVKAKSYDPDDETQSFFKKKTPKGAKHPPLRPSWEPYLVDVAFQTVLCRRAHPAFKVTPYLMLADTSRVSTVDGLNQCFFLAKDEKGRTRVEVSPQNPELGEPLLIELRVQREVEAISQGEHEDGSFDEIIDQYAEAYALDRMLPPTPGRICRDCEYRIPLDGRPQSGPGSQSGFERCWSDAFRLSPKQLAEPLVLDVAALRGVDELIKDGKLFMRDLEESDIDPENEPHAKGGFTQKQRQWEQIRCVKENDPNPVFDLKGLGLALAMHKFPLHMIDFETTRVAIPFTKGRRPYETIAFQFSHHVIHRDGRVEHQTEYLDTRRGVFPNFDFVRALKRALEGDSGTIFRYSHHENTTLKEIRRQIESTKPSAVDPLVDREELIAWIGSVTDDGPRSMIDLCELAKLFFYHPLMGKSYSLKSVLPAILQDSKSLVPKYPAWLRRGPDGKVLDPYQMLEPIFDKGTDQALEGGELLYDASDSIREGGAAMTAYAQMQFTQMSDAERERVSQALLRYCELDTMAMVFLYEYWIEKCAIPE